MKHKCMHILLILLLITSCQNDVNLEAIPLVECAPMPQPVAAAVCFVHNDNIYIWGGRDNFRTNHNDLWAYNTTTDTWKELPSRVPLKARVSASACVIGDCAYIGLGFDGKVQRDSSYLRDFWQYNIQTHQWKRLADFPANTTVKNCLFATEQAIYATYGFNRAFTQDVYRYDINKDMWEKLDVSASAHIPRAMDIVGATCQERHFVGTGFNHGSLRFWAEWIPTEQTFVPRQKILGAGRNAAACCATEDYVYLAGGRHYGDTLTTGFFYSSIQRYSPEQDQWEYVGCMPYEAENLVMAYIKGLIFIGLGENKDGIIQDKWYRFEE